MAKPAAAKKPAAQVAQAQKAAAVKSGNTKRGIATIDLGFRKLNLATTMESMAALEDHFECDFVDIESHIGSTKDVAQFIAHLARGAGEEITDEDIEKIRRAPIPLQDIFNSIKVTQGRADEVEERAPGK